MPRRSSPALSRPASIACPSRHRPAAGAAGRHPVISLSWLFRILPPERVVDGFERQPPLVLTACRLTVTTRAVGGPRPPQHLIQAPAQQRFFAGDGRQQ